MPENTTITRETIEEINRRNEEENRLFQKHAQQYLDMLKRNPDIYAALPAVYRKNPDIATVAIEHDPMNIKYANGLNNFAVAWKAVESDGRTYQYLDENLKMVPPLAENALKSHPEMISEVPSDLLNDYSLMVKVCSNNPSLLSEVGPALDGNKQFYSDVIDKNPDAYKHVPDNIKKNVDFSAIHIFSNPDIYKDAPPTIKRNKVIALKAVSDNYRNFREMPYRLRHNRRFVLQLIKRSPKIINLIPDRYRNNTKFMERAIKQNPLVYRYLAPQEQEQYKEVAAKVYVDEKLEAYKNNEFSMLEFPGKLMKEIDNYVENSLSEQDREEYVRMMEEREIMSNHYYENGKEYEYVFGDRLNDYIDELRAYDAKEVDAEKSGCLIARPAIPGEDIVVYTETGVEAHEVGQEGKWVTQAVDLDGNPVLNAAGQPNIWQQSEENLRKKYDVDHIQENGFVKPKGGVQHFIQTDRNIAVMVPWGENGSLIPQTIDKGGYLNITNMGDVYGIGEAEFGKLYTEKSDIQIPKGFELFTDKSMARDEDGEPKTIAFKPAAKEVGSGVTKAHNFGELQKFVEDMKDREKELYGALHDDKKQRPGESDTKSDKKNKAEGPGGL